MTPNSFLESKHRDVHHTKRVISLSYPHGQCVSEISIIGKKLFWILSIVGTAIAEIEYAEYKQK
uniref:Uncharacterized protein n=1 Tax=Anguilla anguilla TaxID=7936 RepID=A0A0E9X565_ANGAN